MGEAATISFRETTKLFREGDPPAVDHVSFDVNDGEFVVLLGRSGSGKTTLLRMVNRLIEPSGGEIWVEGTEVRALSATELRRHIGYAIQQVGLFPHMTVAQNIAVVPRLLGWNRARIKERTLELLELVDLEPGLFLKRYPRQLSGGQQQRVGIARSIAADPQLMLMDEPFGAIDAITRTELQNELLKIQRKVAKTVLFVTHDVEEALRLADRIVVMRNGQVVQYDTPFELLTKPADDFVKNLLGAGDVLRQLSLVPVSSVMERLNGHEPREMLSLFEDTDVRSALSKMMSAGASEALIVAADEEPVGRLTLRRVLREAAHPEELEAEEAR